ncbi:type VII secretion-associated serine protease mycosin [Actinoplanes sp. OR16]|uniref:type VII secretion-associated serine protease mycosin n=1 Tax=Actinoplanes sp. OR16 TaxID=946334 RepID=UPI001E59A6C1|nr:type VII secretion-associated serine protease mycosin [Actinoplanes sp. OR16]
MALASGSPAFAATPSDPGAVEPPAVSAVPLAVSTFGTPLLAEPAITTDDSVRTDQWQLQALDLANAWSYADGAGVTVAVIDSGVDAHHPDLEGQVLPGIDLVNTKADTVTDPVGHGTTVAGLIAGRNDDDAGVIGVAPKAKILPIRVLDEENRYDDALIVAQGVRWAVDNGAKVINLSLGGSGSSATLAAALDYAFAKDVVVIACTGNASASSSADNTGVWYPAREPGVIAVAGMERDGSTLWDGSITGRETVLTAPATNLVGARGPDDYWRVQGTSFAAPMVSGAAALIRSRWPDMPAGEVVNRLIKTADDRGEPGRDPVFGFGLVNPTAALTADVPFVTDNPLDTTPPPGVARFGSAPVSGQSGEIPSGTDQQGSSWSVTPEKLTASSPAAATNAGGWAAPAEPVTESHRGRYLAIALFLLSALAAGFTVRRFATTTG